MRLPWWSRGWEALSRGHGFDPWSRRIPHAMKQLGPCNIILEPMCPRGRPWWLRWPMLCNNRTHCNEKPAHHSQRVALAHRNYREKPSRSNEEPLHCNKDPAQPKNNNSDSGGKMDFTGNVIQSMLVIILVIIKLVKTSKDLLQKGSSLILKCITFVDFASFSP